MQMFKYAGAYLFIFLINIRTTFMVLYVFNTLKLILLLSCVSLLCWSSPRWTDTDKAAFFIDKPEGKIGDIENSFVCTNQMKSKG